MKVSILCSNYNSLDWIEGYLEMIDSIEMEEFEINFVDANSTDISLSIIKKHPFRSGITANLFKSDERISIYGAWNKAIGMSSGEYCINCNTDDRLYPGSLKILSSYLDQDPSLSLVYGWNNVTRDPSHGTIDGVYQWNEYTDNELMEHCFMGPFPMWRKKDIESVGLFDADYKICGDYEMWLRLASRGKKMKLHSGFIGSYFHNPSGLSTSNEHREQHDRERTQLQVIYGGLRERGGFSSGHH